MTTLKEGCQLNTPHLNGARKKVLWDSQLMCEVFSFLGGDAPRCLTVEQAADLIEMLSQVCKTWEVPCGEHLATIVGPLAAMATKENHGALNHIPSTLRSLQDSADWLWNIREKYKGSPLDLYSLEMTGISQNREIGGLLTFLRNFSLDRLQRAKLAARPERCSMPLLSQLLQSPFSWNIA